MCQTNPSLRLGLRTLPLLHSPFPPSRFTSSSAFFPVAWFHFYHFLVNGLDLAAARYSYQPIASCETPPEVESQCFGDSVIFSVPTGTLHKEISLCHVLTKSCRWSRAITMTTHSVLSFKNNNWYSEKHDLDEKAFFQPAQDACCAPRSQGWLCWLVWNADLWTMSGENVVLVKYAETKHIPSHFKGPNFP